MPRERLIRQSLGSALHLRVKESRVLMVGAGGIGCELLKNLVLTGFGQVHIVDLDTIDLSNLNRQFLFRHEHIKKPKALVAKESAQKFNPNVSIQAHYANIKDSQFSIDWFKSFHIVFNALDNLEARRHVNKMCLAADVPLIDGGTTGFEGYVQVIKKGQSECYDCNAKETPKSFPVCTIRSTPSQPIHCIVWAKSYLFAEIFGTSEDDAPDLDTTEDSENAKEIEALRQEAQALKRIRESTGSADFPRQVFEKVYKEDVERLQSMEDMWKTRQKPEPLDFDKLSQEASALSGEALAAQDQSVWTVAENFAVFESSIRRLATRLEEQRANASAETSTPPVLSFDKDDKDTLDFVSAAANLRSVVFQIELKSEFDIKQMAGNIIPAIATTNAMIAGLCVLQAFKILRNDYSKARIAFLSKSADRMISSEPLGKPRPDCPVCSVSQSQIEADLSRATLSNLVDEILRKQLGYGEELSVSSEAGLLFDPDFDENMSKKFTELSIGQDSFLTVVDEDEAEPRVNLVLSVSQKEFAPEENPVKLSTAAEVLEIPRKVKPAPAPASITAMNGNNNNTNSHNQAATQVEQPNGTAVPGKGKRKRSVSASDNLDQEADVAKKRGKVSDGGGGGDEAGEEAAVAESNGNGAGQGDGISVDKSDGGIAGENGVEIKNNSKSDGTEPTTTTTTTTTVMPNGKNPPLPTTAPSSSSAATGGSSAKGASADGALVVIDDGEEATTTTTTTMGSSSGGGRDENNGGNGTSEGAILIDDD